MSMNMLFLNPLRTALSGLGVLLAGLPTAGAESVRFTEDLQPLLDQRCVVCHSGPGAPLGLSLDSLEGLLAGSERGPVVVSGDVDGSELIRRLRGDALPRMPLTGPPWFSEAQIARFAEWIEAGLPQGAPAARSVESTPPVAAEPGTWDDIVGVLTARCVKCHSEDGLMGPAPEGLVLVDHASVTDARERARVVPGHPGASELMRRILGQARPRMPLDGPPYLTTEEIERIRLWIEAGAPDASGQPAEVPVGARVRLNGRIDADGRLDGLPLDITGAERIDDRPLPGRAMQLRGRVRADGSIAIERLRERD